jgi:hypothetical protein
LREKKASKEIKNHVNPTKTVSVTDALVNVTTMKSESRGSEENVCIVFSPLIDLDRY